MKKNHEFGNKEILQKNKALIHFENNWSLIFCISSLHDCIFIKYTINNSADSETIWKLQKTAELRNCLFFVFGEWAVKLSTEISFVFNALPFNDTRNLPNCHSRTHSVLLCIHNFYCYTSIKIFSVVLLFIYDASFWCWAENIEWYFFECFECLNVGT